MAAPALKKVLGNSASTTMSSSVSDSDTAFPITATTNFQSASGEGMAYIDEGTANAEYGYSTGLAGSSLTIPVANRGLEGTSAVGHDVQASVKGILTAGMWNDLIDSLTNVLDQSTGNLDTTKIADLSTAQTLQNKRIDPRTNTTTSSATPTINTDTTDIFTITALATAITSMTTNLSGTPVNGQKLTIRIKDDGTARAITWGSSFASRGGTLPTTTVLGKYTYVGLIYNSTASKWDCVAVAQEA